VSFALLFLVSILALFLVPGPFCWRQLKALIWDFFIPLHLPCIETKLDVMMLIMFFIIALLNGILLEGLHQEKRCDKEERTHALYQLPEN
jgi:hypothetical protein